MGTGVLVWEDKWPVLGRHEQATVWLHIWTDLGRAPRTIDADARGLAEYLVMCERDDVDPVTANRAHIAVYVREWLRILEVTRRDPVRTGSCSPWPTTPRCAARSCARCAPTTSTRAHRTLRVRAETTKNRRERIVPYSASTGVLLGGYLFYTPKDSSKVQLLEAKDNLQRMLACVPLTDNEQAAVHDGQAALDQLLDRLADAPTPAGPSPRQLGAPTTATRLPIVEVTGGRTGAGADRQTHQCNNGSSWSC